jgi:hypothetical protein
MKRLIISLLLMWLFESCGYNHTDNIEDLGKGYYYLGDGSESQILQSLKPNNFSSGRTVVPAEVIEYNYNELFIIVKSVDHIKKTELYWIVNKHAKDSVEPLDLKAFDEKLKTIKLDLNLKPRK